MKYADRDIMCMWPGRQLCLMEPSTEQEIQYKTCLFFYKTAPNYHFQTWLKILSQLKKSLQPVITFSHIQLFTYWQRLFLVFDSKP